MNSLSPFLRLIEENKVAFWCPGCNSSHNVVYGPNGWKWNGDAERPTFEPSVLVRSGHYIPNSPPGCWCTYAKEHPNEEIPFKCGICHSFVTDGKIRFLSDSTHALAGQTVPLPPWPT